MSELHNHFVKLNSTDIAEAPLIFIAIIGLEVLLSIFVVIFQPFVCISILRAEVIHRNFRWQLALSSVYFSVEIWCRFILLYYQLNDILPSKEDKILFYVETIRDAIMSYFCAIPGSFAFERYIATHYWSWYEKGSPSTISVLILAEATNIIPAVMTAWLCYTEVISNTTNYAFAGIMLIISLVVFIRTYLVNIRLLETITAGATIELYSVARTFQVRENVEVMAFMRRVSLPAAVSSTIAFAGFGWKIYGPTEWRLSRNIAYAMFDLGSVIIVLSYFSSVLTGNARILKEFKDIHPLARVLCKRDENRQREHRSLPVTVETDMYFVQLQESWANPHISLI